MLMCSAAGPQFRERKLPSKDLKFSLISKFFSNYYDLGGTRVSSIQLLGPNNNSRNENPKDSTSEAIIYISKVYASSIEI